VSDPVTTWPCDSVDLYEGEIITFKGKLEGVRYARDASTGYGHFVGRARETPCLMLTFSDWSEVFVNIVDQATARGIRIPLSSYVTVKARVVDEDGTLEAIAIWTPGGVPQPLARDPEKASGDLTERKSA